MALTNELPPLLLGPDRNDLVVAVREGKIAFCGRGTLPGLLVEGAEQIPLDRFRLETGDVNAHTHLYSGLAPLGMPAPTKPPNNFVEILERVWWRLDRALDRETLRASARLAVAEALLAGTTTLVDHHESPNLIEGSLDLLAEACEELGIRALLAYGATERNGGREEARRGLAECRRFARENRSPRLRALVGLHASFTVSDETIAEAGELARESNVPIHVHVAEDLADVEDAKRRGDIGPLERLFRLQALPSRSVLAHGVHLSADQVAWGSDAGAWFVQNPRSNRGNRVGWPKGLLVSTRVALGTDGYPADMAEEKRALLAEGAERGEDPAILERRAEGSRALAAEQFGVSLELAPGSEADLVARDDAGRARLVIVAGRIVVREGELVGADIEEIREDARRQAPRLWERMLGYPES
jgi:cytosine/adenosine deaminase-related metal-dependent hydrolase